MKYITLTLAALFAALTVSAQNMVTATQAAKTAKEALDAGNYVSALAGFKDALSQASQCGQEGLNLVSTCKEILPKLMKKVANVAYSKGDYDTAVSSLKEAIAFSGVADQETADLKSLASNILARKASSLIEKGQYSAAVQTCEEVLDEDPFNGLASLNLGMAKESLGQYEEAIKAYKTAAANGQTKNANIKLGQYFLNRATKELKANDLAAAVEDAVTSNEYVANPQALQIAGNASMLSGKRDDAIKYFENYLKAAPKAENAGQVAYAVGALCKEAGYDTKAKSYFDKALSDAKYGAEAAKALKALQ